MLKIESRRAIISGQESFKIGWVSLQVVDRHSVEGGDSQGLLQPQMNNDDFCKLKLAAGEGFNPLKCTPQGFSWRCRRRRRGFESSEDELELQRLEDEDEIRKTWVLTHRWVQSEWKQDGEEKENVENRLYLCR